MGLSIASKSRHQYHAGYGGIHAVRYFAYLHCGGERSAVDFQGSTVDRWTNGGGPIYDWAFVVACAAFPNLMLHSDCDGDYSLKGRVDPLDSSLQHGNSRELLKELQKLKRTVDAESKSRNLRRDTYDMLLRLVRDVVKNHDGYLRFC